MRKLVSQVERRSTIWPPSRSTYGPPKNGPGAKPLPVIVESTTRRILVPLTPKSLLSVTCELATVVRRESAAQLLPVNVELWILMLSDAATP
ncbi:hypothetical protein K2Z84_20805 [Candidatus Binatia bacterium]|nr:hypothetical protein [Candidatus Binatia bacterium]